MTLEKAFSYAIDNEGIGIISEARLINILNDLQAFDTPAVKRIVSTMVTDGYMNKLKLALSQDEYALLFNDVSNRLVHTEGFQADIVDYVMNCILYAVHTTNNTPSLPQSEKVTIKPVTKGKPSSSGKRELSAIQANDNYLIDFNGQSYELDESQYKAILRKKDMPAERLELWLKFYVEENK